MLSLFPAAPISSLSTFKKDFSGSGIDEEKLHLEKQHLYFDEPADLVQDTSKLSLVDVVYTPIFETFY